MRSQATALTFSVRPRIVLKYLGLLCVVLAVLTAVPLSMFFLFSDYGSALRYGVVTALLAAGGAGLSRLQVSSEIQANEAMVIGGLMFLLAPLAMTVPMMSSGFGAVDAFFGAISGICEELGLEDTIIPAQTISGYLADLASGIDILEVRTAIKGDARFFQFTADNAEAGPLENLALPDEAEVICLYRGDNFILAGKADRIKKGDEVVILTHRGHLNELRERWRPRAAEADNAARGKRR